MDLHSWRLVIIFQGAFLYILLIKIIADLTDDLFELPEFLDSDGIRQLHVGCTDILPLSI